jgi:hypothetical protein
MRWYVAVAAPPPPPTAAAAEDEGPGEDAAVVEAYVYGAAGDISGPGDENMMGDEYPERKTA